MSNLTRMEASTAYQERLLARVAAEQDAAPDDLIFPVHLDLAAVLALVGNLQLALRHPRNCGPTADTARAFIAGMIAKLQEHGFAAHAELLDLGNHPELDARPGDYV
ncbi:MAG TPA: hypothetical protein VFA33_07435 [Bryobacteraceae bacterium]|nr:hypothetical protein [Bryobacteraceae bacterium]